MPGEIAVLADNPLERDEVRAIVHEEIDRLADAQRLPILLCASRTSHEEAAQRLRWPVGTVKSRLVRGRRRLEGRLARRGLAPRSGAGSRCCREFGGGRGCRPSGGTRAAGLAAATTRAALQSARCTTTTFAQPVLASVSDRSLRFSGRS